MSQTYAAGPRNKVHRYMKRAVYDYEFIHTVVNTASVAHVAFPPSLDQDADPFPAVLPMIAVMAKYPDAQDDDADFEALDLYLHGYVSARLMRLSTIATGNGSGNGTSEAEAADVDDHGLPLTVSATLVDGLVLSLTPYNHSYNYRSAILHGFATPITDEDEKLWAMQVITDKVLPHRWQNSRVPPTPTEVKSTNVLKVRIASASGKQRKGQPGDDKKDTQDEQVTERVWTGVVPCWEEKGAPVTSRENKSKGGVPAYVEKAVEEWNVKRRDEAVRAVEG